MLKGHIVQTLYCGNEVVNIVALFNDAALLEPIELSEEDKKSKLKSKMWNLEVESKCCTRCN